jgi:hypothetical protein
MMMLCKSKGTHSTQPIEKTSSTGRTYVVARCETWGGTLNNDVGEPIEHKSQLVTLIAFAPIARKRLLAIPKGAIAKFGGCAYVSDYSHGMITIEVGEATRDEEGEARRVAEEGEALARAADGVKPPKRPKTKPKLKLVDTASLQAGIALRKRQVAGGRSRTGTAIFWRAT